jgi:DNA-binding CsgD family transcriptional regulator
MPAKAITDRDEEVLKLVAEGHSSKQIADILVISVKTVERHRANMLQKLGLKDRLELTRYAIRAGLNEPYRQPRRLVIQRLHRPHGADRGGAVRTVRADGAGVPQGVRASPGPALLMVWRSCGTVRTPSTTFASSRSTRCARRSRPLCTAATPSGA